MNDKPIQTLQELAQNLKADCYYFVLSFHIGDTYLFCRGKKNLADQLKGKVIAVIKPSHEPVLKLFDDEDYVVCEEKGFLIYNCEKCFKLPNVAMSPTLKKLVPANWEAFKNLQQIDIDSKKINSSPANGRLPTNLPKMSENLKQKIKAIAPLDKIILFCPEAQSMRCLPFIIFQYVCECLQRQGYKIIVNIPKCKYYLKTSMSGVYDLDLSLEELIALALSCAGVISTRSGFCDIIAPHCKNLKIYFTEPREKIWSLKLANPKYPPQEINIKECLIYQSLKTTLNNSLPYRLYERYCVKGFLRKLRTPFTLYFKIYKKDKQQNTIKIDKDLPTQLTQTYEYQLGIALQKACERFWWGGFLLFPFAYLKIRKEKGKKFLRMSEIM